LEALICLFFHDNNKDAVAALVVCEFPSLRVVFERMRVVKLTAPYIAGYLAFREVSFLIELIEEVKKTAPAFLPQVILVDGNGILHYRKFGLACHLGVLVDIPTIGVAKKLLCIEGVTERQVETLSRNHLHLPCHHADIKSDSGTSIASVIKTGVTPSLLYVSQGHRVSLATSVAIVKKCMSNGGLPAPVDQADLRSRAYVEKLKKSGSPRSTKTTRVVTPLSEFLDGKKKNRCYRKCKRKS